MQSAASLNQSNPKTRELMAALPLYAASLVVTLTGVGGVGVTITSTTWLPLWALLAVLGHGVSLALRYARVSPETVFYPVMLLGSVVVLQQVVGGGTLGGLEIVPAAQSIDMATASVVGALAVIRSFTLVTNSSLLFSPVPAITMLALVGSSNLNAEVPVFFGLFLLSSLFITGYEAHLRRMDRLNRPAGPVLFHLLTSWGMALAVGGAALVFPVLLQPLLGQFSPFNLPGLNRMRQSPNFTQPSTQRANVGQGPIRLSPTPVFEVYTTEAGRLRTTVFSDYSGRDWRANPMETPTEISSEEQVEGPEVPGASIRYRHNLFRFPRVDEGLEPAPARTVEQRILTKSFNSPGLPGLGEITEVIYPGLFLMRHINGTVSGTSHVTAGKTFQVKSVIREPSQDQLRAAAPVDADDPAFEDTLTLPQSTLRVQELARRITAGKTNALDRIQAILDYIEKNCTYTLQEEYTPPGEDAAAYYLFTTKRGACDLAATATAVMCRAVGIPARVAVGYAMDEPLPQGGGYMVRQEHAHMWTEAYFPGHGWMPFDAAPPISSIRDHPLQVFWYRLTGMFSRLGGVGLDAVLLGLVVLGTGVLLASWALGVVRERLRTVAQVRRLREGSPAVAIAFTYDRALSRLARRGWGRERWMTPSEFLEHLRSAWSGSPEALKALERLTALFLRAHYAETAAAADVSDAEAAARELLRLAPPREKTRSGAVRRAAEGTP